MDTLTEILNSIFVANKQKSVPKDTLTVKLNKYKHIEVQTELPEAPKLIIPEPEPEAEAEAERVVEAEPVVEVEAEVEAKPVVEVEAEVEVEPEVEAEPEVEPKVEVEIEVEPEVEVEAEVGRKVSISLKERNVLIVNSSFEENIASLVEILSDSADSSFKNELNIVTSSEKKPRFKKMLIEHPELYFTNLNFNTKQKEGIVIIDFDHLMEVKDLSPFLSDDIYLIVLSTEYSSYIAGLYNLMNDFKPSVVINTKDSTKALQKKFYTKIVKNTIVDDLSLDDYLDQIKESPKVIVKSGHVDNL